MSLGDLVSELKEIYAASSAMASSFDTPTITAPLEALEKSANAVGKAWSRSWMGYQSRVYYHGLELPPPGAHFSSEWGMMGTRGNWAEFPEVAVEDEIKRRAGNPDISEAQDAAKKGRRFFNEKRDDVLSILRSAKAARAEGTKKGSSGCFAINSAEKAKVA